MRKLFCGNQTLTHYGSQINPDGIDREFVAEVCQRHGFPTRAAHRVGFDTISVLRASAGAIMTGSYAAEVGWEYAARGGNKSRGYTYSGSNDLYRVGWYTENSGGTTHPVGQKLDNELGLYDMSGNVREWTSDHYSSDYNSPRSSSGLVNRGGGWNVNARYCRASRRGCNGRTARSYGLGLRLAL